MYVTNGVTQRSQQGNWLLCSASPFNLFLPAQAMLSQEHWFPIVDLLLDACPFSCLSHGLGLQHTLCGILSLTFFVCVCFEAWLTWCFIYCKAEEKGNINNRSFSFNFGVWNSFCWESKYTCGDRNIKEFTDVRTVEYHQSFWDGGT